MVSSYMLVMQLVTFFLAVGLRGVSSLGTSSMTSSSSSSSAESARTSTNTPQTKTTTIPTTTTTAGDQAAQVWRSVASAIPSERSELLHAEAPPGLAGTYYVNGLASCTYKNGRLVHPFESHGFLKAITFGPKNHGAISLKARYVQTPVRTWEEKAGRPLFRGAMSSVADMRSGRFSDRLSNALSPTTRETANLAVRAWGDKLIATADNCRFFGIDRDSLDTLGAEIFDDALKGYQMLAHTRVDIENNRLIAAALAYDPLNQATDMTFFEFDDKGELLSKVEHTFPAFVTHDWTITPNYYVVPAASAVFDIGKLPSLITGGMPATEMFSLDSEAPGTLLLIPRDGGEPIRAERSDKVHSTIFHLGPAYEKDGQVIVHPFVFDRYQFGGEMGFDLHTQSFNPTEWAESNGGPHLEKWKVHIDAVDANSAFPNTRKVTTERMNNIISDMPTIHPRRDGLECNSVYTVCGIREKGWFPFNSIAKHCLKTGECQIWPPEAASMASGDNKDWDGGTVVRSEPLFVPKSSAIDEDDGYILSTVHDAKNGETRLEILDAKHFAEGPIQTISLGELWGWNIHSSFEPISQ